MTYEMAMRAYLDTLIVCIVISWEIRLQKRCLFCVYAAMPQAPRSDRRREKDNMIEWDILSATVGSWGLDWVCMCVCVRVSTGYTNA